MFSDVESTKLQATNVLEHRAFCMRDELPFLVSVRYQS